MATEPHTTDWELRLGFLIHDVSRLRRSAFDRCLKPLNVTRSQWWVLAYLSREDGMTQSQLAEELDLGKVAIGGLIDRLEKSGLRAPRCRRQRPARQPRLPRAEEQAADRAHAQGQPSPQRADPRRPRRREAGAARALTLDAMKRNLLGYLQTPES